MDTERTEASERAEAPARRFDTFSANAGLRIRTTAAKQPRRPLHGVLLLDKPIGWSSNDALQKVKGMLRAEKAGHTGTLDPLATGLLPLCFGAATKFSHAGLEADKTYRATLKLGVTRAGGDLEGEITATRPIVFDDAALHAALAALTGTIEQRAPMHSALKHAGRPLYAYARAGMEVERAPRRVTVRRLVLVSRQGDELVVDACVSKGTYVRTLAEDLGEALGCGAHLGALRRLASGGLDVAGAIDIDALQALAPGEREARLLSPDALLGEAPAILLNAGDAGRFLAGLRRRTDAAEAPLVRVYGPAVQARAVFLGSAHIKAGELIPTRLLSPVEAQALATHDFRISTASPP